MAENDDLISLLRKQASGEAPQLPAGTALPGDRILSADEVKKQIDQMRAQLQAQYQQQLQEAQIRAKSAESALGTLQSMQGVQAAELSLQNLPPGWTVSPNLYTGYATGASYALPQNMPSGFEDLPEEYLPGESSNGGY